MKITFSTEGEEISFRKRDIKQISKTRNTERKQGTQTRNINHAKRTIISKYRNKDQKKKKKINKGPNKKTEDQTVSTSSLRNHIRVLLVNVKATAVAIVLLQDVEAGVVLV